MQVKDKDDPNIVEGTDNMILQQMYQKLIVEGTAVLQENEWMDISMNDVECEPKDELQKMFHGSYRDKETGNLIIPPLDKIKSCG